jgi:hypothetical protein
MHRPRVRATRRRLDHVEVSESDTSASAPFPVPEAFDNTGEVSAGFAAAFMATVRRADHLASLVVVAGLAGPDNEDKRAEIYETILHDAFGYARSNAGKISTATQS